MKRIYLFSLSLILLSTLFSSNSRATDFPWVEGAVAVRCDEGAWNLYDLWNSDFTKVTSLDPAIQSEVNWFDHFGTVLPTLAYTIETKRASQLIMPGSFQLGDEDQVIIPANCEKKLIAKALKDTTSDLYRFYFDPSVLQLLPDQQQTLALLRTLYNTLVSTPYSAEGTGIFQSLIAGSALAKDLNAWMQWQDALKLAQWDFAGVPQWEFAGAPFWRNDPVCPFGGCDTSGYLYQLNEPLAISIEGTLLPLTLPITQDQYISCTKKVDYQNTDIWADCDFKSQVILNRTNYPTFFGDIQNLAPSPKGMLIQYEEEALSIDNANGSSADFVVAGQDGTRWNFSALKFTKDHALTQANLNVDGSFNLKGLPYTASVTSDQPYQETYFAPSYAPGVYSYGFVFQSTGSFSINKTTLTGLKDVRTDTDHAYDLDLNALEISSIQDGSQSALKIPGNLFQGQCPTYTNVRLEQLSTTPVMVRSQCLSGNLASSSSHWISQYNGAWETDQNNIFFKPNPAPIPTSKLTTFPGIIDFQGGSVLLNSVNFQTDLASLTVPTGNGILIGLLGKYFKTTNGNFYGSLEGDLQLSNPGASIFNFPSSNPLEVDGDFNLTYESDTNQLSDLYVYIRGTSSKTQVFHCEDTGKVAVLVPNQEFYVQWTQKKGIEVISGYNVCQ